MDEIVNRVAQSTLQTIDLDDYIDQVQIEYLDLKPFLYQEMILREKDFRATLKTMEWEIYRDKYVVIGCSVDVIIPTWAYMLLGSKLMPVVKSFRYGDKSEIERMKIDMAIQDIDKEDFQNKKVVIKGCGNLEFRDYAYTEVTKVLVNQVTSLMYGEPCSTVPIHKKAKQKG